MERDGSDIRDDRATGFGAVRATRSLQDLVSVKRPASDLARAVFRGSLKSGGNRRLPCRSLPFGQFNARLWPERYYFGGPVTISAIQKMIPPIPQAIKNTPIITCQYFTRIKPVSFIFALIRFIGQ